MITVSTRLGLVLAMVGLVLTRTLAIASEAPGSLNEHLRPLAAYPGIWKWEWTDEHGQAMQGLSTVIGDRSGAFLIDRTSDIEDGKLAPTELNIYFWRSESKTIGGVGFTATGDHGYSSVFVRDNQWVEQSSGY